MMNFSGKGNTGWFSSGNNPPARVNHVHHTSDRTINGGNVDYWFKQKQDTVDQAHKIFKEKDERIEEAQRIAMERRAINAGLRAVIRELLKTLRAEKPDHPLLDKKVRDRIFAEFEKEEMNGMLKNPDRKPWSPRERPLEYVGE